MSNYLATVSGEIIGKRGKLLTQTLHHTGYLVVGVINKQYRVHRLVWEYFNGSIPKDKCINHIDGNKQNNCLYNLECVSYKENTKHAFDNGLMQGQPGENNSRAKLSNERALKLFSLLPMHSNDYLGEMFELHPRYVSLIRHKRRWKELWKQYEGSETIP